SILLCRASGRGVLRRSFCAGHSSKKCRSNWRSRNIRAQATYTLGFFLWVGSSACTTTKMTPAADAHAGHFESSVSTAAADTSGALPADAGAAAARLAASPRHGEWVMIHTGNGDSLHTWVGYPERSTKARVVVGVGGM